MARLKARMASRKNTRIRLMAVKIGWSRGKGKLFFVLITRMPSGRATTGLCTYLALVQASGSLVVAAQRALTRTTAPWISQAMSSTTHMISKDWKGVRDSRGFVCFQRSRPGFKSDESIDVGRTVLGSRRAVPTLTLYSLLNSIADTLSRLTWWMEVVIPSRKW